MIEGCSDIRNREIVRKGRECGKQVAKSGGGGVKKTKKIAG